MDIKTNLGACKSFDSAQYWGKGKCALRGKVFLISGGRDMQQLLDLAKCADIICPIVSCRAANIQQIAFDPLNECKAFDEFGYAVINMLRS